MFTAWGFRFESGHEVAGSRAGHVQYLFAKEPVEHGC